MKAYFNISLILLILFIGMQAAFAQCAGKTINIQLPGDWNKTQIYMLWEAGLRSPAIPATQVDGWTRFTMPSGLSNDRASSDFSFSKAGTNIDNGDNKWIARTGFNISGNRPMSINSFTCANFGSSNTLYIYENPSRPGTTVFNTNAPKQLFFLPPHTKSWLQGIPYIINSEGDITPMKIDMDACGWYKAVYFDGEPPSLMIIGLGPRLDEPVGGGAINLAEKFEEHQSNTVYFLGENNRWLTSRDGVPEESDRCSYNFAAIIYDTDASANSSFFDYGACTFPNGCLYEGKASTNPFGSPVDGSGIAKGIPKQSLVKDLETGKMKMEFNQARDGWTQQNFIDAFKPTAGKNIVRCYDMTFQRNKDGLWDFNSNKLCSDGSMDLNGNCAHTGGYYLGGFYPPELQTRGDADYSTCPNCDYQRASLGWVEYRTSSSSSLEGYVSQFCYDRGRNGTSNGPNINDCGTEFAEGAFVDGDTPQIWVWSNDRDCRLGPCSAGSPSGTNPIGTGPTISGGTWSNKTMLKNAHFCFESHATFKYDPAQEFFFSGDDDIWVFINNKMVIDLGGSHLAAPGYVALKNLGLTEGETYPIDIFFCDRRTTMSNVRIASNIYFGQTANGAEAGLFLRSAGRGVGEICLQEGANTCAAITGMVDVSEPICGAELAPRLSYELAVQGIGELPLSPGNPDCEWATPTQGVCYGGISLNNGVVSVDESAITERFFVDAGFNIYASAEGYTLNVSTTEPTPIITKPVRVLSATPQQYYTLKGIPLGTQKPKNAGAYIVRKNGTNKIEVVK